MAAPTTAPFEALVLEVETDTPGTYAKICGMKDFSVGRSAEVDRVETPADCTDESLPYQIEKDVKSLDFSVSAEAVWSAESHGTLMDWFYSSAAKNVRVQHVNAASGETEFETGPAYLTQLDTNRTKGQKVNFGTITIEFDGTPTRTAAA